MWIKTNQNQIANRNQAINCHWWNPLKFKKKPFNWQNTWKSRCFASMAKLYKTLKIFHPFCFRNLFDFFVFSHLRTQLVCLFHSRKNSFLFFLVLKMFWNCQSRKLLIWEVLDWTKLDYCRIFNWPIQFCHCSKRMRFEITNCIDTKPPIVNVNNLCRIGSKWAQLRKKKKQSKIKCIFKI